MGHSKPSKWAIQEYQTHLDTNYYFAIRETRKVRSDHCISWSGRLLQLLPDPKDPSLVDESVTVHVVPEGDIYVYHGKRPVPYRRVLDSEPVSLKPRREKVRQVRTVDPKAAQRRRGWLFAQG